MIVCGWCGVNTGAPCRNCGRDPALPYVQRGITPAVVPDPQTGRPALDPNVIGRRLREATSDNPTTAQLAERLGVSEKTVRRWRDLVE